VDSAPKFALNADADVVRLTEGCITKPFMRGFVEPPESLARGTLSEGFPTNLGDLFVPAATSGGTERSRETETAGTGDEESYDPVVPVKVGNWHSRNPLEGRGEHQDVPIWGYMATLRGRGPCPQN
jgi:hypothetical protein